MATDPDRDPASPRGWEHHEVMPGLHRLRCGISNAYLWWPAGPGGPGHPAQQGATLIDTGPTGTFSALVAALDDIGLTAGRLERIVVTHFHDDHTGTAAEVAAWSGARVVAGAGDAAFIRGELAGPAPLLTAAEQRLHAAIDALADADSGGSAAPVLLPCRVDQEVGEGDVMDFAGGAHVVAVPGHTPGSIAVHLPALGVLLTGDAVAEHDGQVVLGPFSMDRVQVWADAQRLAGLGADIACFGHGEPVLTDASALLRSATDAFA